MHHPWCAGVEGQPQAFGTLEYWLRLRVPMEQALRLYKERIKAMGYLSTSASEGIQVRYYLTK